MIDLHDEALKNELVYLATLFINETIFLAKKRKKISDLFRVQGAERFIQNLLDCIEDFSKKEK